MCLNEPNIMAKYNIKMNKLENEVYIFNRVKKYS